MKNTTSTSLNVMLPAIERDILILPHTTDITIRNPSALDEARKSKSQHLFESKGDRDGKEESCSISAVLNISKNEN